MLAVITEPDLAELRMALTECAVPAGEIGRVADCLTRPPLTLGASAAVYPESVVRLISVRVGISFACASSVHAFVRKRRVFDGDLAARMLRLNQCRPDSSARWKTLSRTDRKQAKTLWDWFGDDAHGLRVTPQGRQPIIDSATTLYCARVLCEAAGQRQFKFSRPESGAGAPTGPMWRALMEALPLAHSFLARRYWPQVRIVITAENVARIITASRSKVFCDLCKRLYLGPTSDDVAASADVFRHVFTLARRPTIAHQKMLDILRPAQPLKPRYRRSRLR